MWDTERCYPVDSERSVQKVFAEGKTLDGLNFRDAQVFLSWRKPGEESAEAGQTGENHAM